MKSTKTKTNELKKLLDKIADYKQDGDNLTFGDLIERIGAYTKIRILPNNLTVGDALYLRETNITACPTVF